MPERAQMVAQWVTTWMANALIVVRRVHETVVPEREDIARFVDRSQ